MEEEKILWQGSSSQIVNLPVFVLCGLAVGVLVGLAILLRSTAPPSIPIILGGAAVLPVLFALCRAFLTRSRQYQITTERVRIKQGLLSKRTDEVELYRIRDYVLFEPFALRLFRLGDILLPTDDNMNPRIELKAVPQAEALKDQIRHHVEICRDKKRVRVTEFEGGQNQ